MDGTRSGNWRTKRIENKIENFIVLKKNCNKSAGTSVVIVEDCRNKVDICSENFAGYSFVSSKLTRAKERF